MKKFYLCLLASILLLLLFFTLFGDALYEKGKPAVTAFEIDYWSNYYHVPLEALRSDGAGDYVYVLHSTAPFIPTLQANATTGIITVPPPRGAYNRMVYTAFRVEVLEVIASGEAMAYMRFRERFINTPVEGVVHVSVGQDVKIAVSESAPLTDGARVVLAQPQEP